MHVTINTDASYSMTHHVASYAVWLVSSHGRVVKSGQVEGEIWSSVVAEYKAILKGLELLVEQNYTDVTKIVINSDCQPAMDVMRGKNHRRWTEELHKETDRLLALLKLDRSKVKCLHVPAHKPIESKRGFVNNHLDRLAKKEIGKAIKLKTCPELVS